MVVSYIKGIGEKFKKICNKQGIQAHFKGTNTVKQLLMAPKDKDPKLTKVELSTDTNGQHQLHRTIHRGIWKITRRKVQRTSQGSITHTPTHIHYRTASQCRLLHHYRQGGAGAHKKHQGSHVHQSKWSITKQELGKISTSTSMGPSTQGHTLTTTQVILQHCASSPHTGTTSLTLP